MELTAVIYKEDDIYVALCPELDIANQGYTVEEARKNLKEAVILFLECASEEEVKERFLGGIYISSIDVVSAQVEGPIGYRSLQNSGETQLQ